jgi:hypothetical protein
MASIRTYNASDNAQRAIAHMCLQATTSTEFPSLPPEPCLRLRAEVFFPSCWDGVNLDSSNHKDHVSQPIKCHILTSPWITHLPRWPTPPSATTISASAPLPTPWRSSASSTNSSSTPPPSPTSTNTSTPWAIRPATGCTATSSTAGPTRSPCRTRSRAALARMALMPRPARSMSMAVRARPATRSQMCRRRWRMWV